MEEVGGVLVFVAVAHKFVSASRRQAAVDDGTRLGEFVVDEVGPLGIGVGTAGDELGGRGVVVEVFAQSGGDVLGEGARR